MIRDQGLDRIELVAWTVFFIFGESRLECVDGKMPEIRPTPAITSGPPPFKMKVISL